jgi:hypothetical protein
MSTIWNGTPQEGLELCEIVKKYCSCATTETGAATRCASHWMLLAEQRALDGLVFARRIGPRLRQEEFEIPTWVPRSAL